MDMKKTKKSIILLLACMFCVSAGLLCASIYARGSNAQTTQTPALFDAESGIRYNSITKVFEVFNASGVSWIAADRWVNAVGDISPNSTQPLVGEWAQANYTATYNIMQDIGFARNASYNSAFDVNKITILAGGVIDGNGFFLKDFPFRTLASAGSNIVSCLVQSNYGIIRNLNMSNSSNAVFPDNFTQKSAAVIVANNSVNGLITNCAVYGSYTSDKYLGLYGIAGANNGTIMNCTNNADLTNTRQGITYAAGISELSSANANVVNNINNGNITAISETSHVAGIGIITSNVACTSLNNINNADLKGEASASGIIGGGVANISMKAVNNVSNGTVDATQIFALYYGHITVDSEPPSSIPASGIKWNTELKVFSIYNTDGVSYIASGYYISNQGLISTDPASVANGYVLASRTALYRIMNDIDYAPGASFNSGFNPATNGEGPILDVGGVIDGGGYTLKDFPVRYAGAIGGTHFASAFLLNVLGTVRNLNIHINAEVSNVGAVHIGGMTGRVTGLLVSCAVTGFLTFSDTVSTVGGICAQFANGRIEKVTTAVDIDAGTGRAGGIVGDTLRNGIDISGSANFGSVKGSHTGGVGGWSSGYAWSVNNFINYGSIVGTIAAGGVFSVTYLNHSMGNLVNYGDITVTNASGSAGGIAGTVISSSGGIISDSFNYGNIRGATIGNLGSFVGQVDDTPELIGGDYRRVKLRNSVNYGGIGTISGGALSYGSSLRFVAYLPYEGADFSLPGIEHGVDGNYSFDPSDPTKPWEALGIPYKPYTPK